MWMSHPGVTGVVTVADNAFYGGWDTMGWVVAAAPVGPPLVDAGWPVSQGEVTALVGTAVAAQIPAAIAPALATERTTERALQSATFALVSAGRPGSRWVALGDSITAGISNGRYMDMTQLVSMGRMRLVKNAGVGGDTAAMMLARFDADVAPYSPNLITILAGTNDTGVTAALASYQTSIQAIVGKCYAIGATPVIMTIPPNSSGTPANRRQQIVIFNAWLRIYAQARGIALVDLFAALVDPATGNYVAAYNLDGTHPTPAAMTIIGTALNSTLAPWLPPQGTLVGNDTVDLNQCIKNPLFLGQTANPGVRADSWNTYGAGGTYTTDATDTTIKGVWQNCAITAGTGVGLISQAATGFAVTVGHTYALAGLMKSSGAALTNVSLNLHNGSAAVAGAVLNGAGGCVVAKGAFYVEWLAVGTPSALSVNVIASGTGSFGVAQLCLYDLTAMGLAA